MQERLKPITKTTTKDLLQSYITITAYIIVKYMAYLAFFILKCCRDISKLRFFLTRVISSNFPTISLFITSSSFRL